MYVLQLLLNYALLLLLLLLCLFLTTLIHELGHVLMYRIFYGDKDWHITVGIRRPIIMLKKFTLRILPIAGSWRGSHKSGGTKLQSIMTYLGGPLANVFFFALLFTLLQIIGADGTTLARKNIAWFLSFACWLNVFQFVAAVIPLEGNFWPVKNYTSDGMRVLRKIRETN